jgi:cobalt-zinc-cadmium resistance protein CzcA
LFEKNLHLQQAALRLLVRNIFIEYHFQQARLQHLLRIDSLYDVVVKMAAKRLQVGETNKLESAGFRQQQMIGKQEISACEIQIQRLLIQLKVVLRTNELRKPAGMFEEKFVPFALADSAAALQHPLLQLRQEQVKTAMAETGLEKALRRPELEVGYNNQSLIGFQTLRNGTEKFYEAGNRFSTAQVGISFQLFGKATKARIKAAGYREKVLENEAEATRLNLLGEWKWRVGEQQMLWQQMLQFEKELLPQSAIILETADLELKAGNLNYLNWMVLVEPALQMRLQYFDRMVAYKRATAELQYMVENF